MLPSPCPLDPTIRAAACDMLNRLSAFAITLNAAAFKAHHNVVGLHFGPLHELFKRAYEAADGWHDRLAERVTTLGGNAIDTLEEALLLSSMTPFATDITDGLALVREIADRFDAFVKGLYEAAQRAEVAGLIADVNVLGELADKAEHLGGQIRRHAL